MEKRAAGRQTHGVTALFAVDCGVVFGLLERSNQAAKAGGSVMLFVSGNLLITLVIVGPPFARHGLPPVTAQPIERVLRDSSSLHPDRYLSGRERFGDNVPLSLPPRRSCHAGSHRRATSLPSDSCMPWPGPDRVPLLAPPSSSSFRSRKRRSSLRLIVPTKRSPSATSR